MLWDASSISAMHVAGHQQSNPWKEAEDGFSSQQVTC
jgi:hypothetical protein